MKTKTIQFIALTGVMFVSLTGCATRAVRYVTEPPKTIAVPEGAAPVNLIVTDNRQKSESRTSEDKGEQELRDALLNHPELVLTRILGELFVKSGVELSEQNPKTTLNVEILKFDVSLQGGDWKGVVRLKVSNTNTNTTLETTAQRPNILGASDGEKVLNQALSQTIDGIDWASLF